MRRILSILMALILSLSLFGSLAGCEFLDDLFGAEFGFSKTDLSGHVGDSIDMSEYISGDMSSGFSLSSSNELVAVVTSQSYIKLMGEGVSTITAQAGTKKSTLSIRATFDQPRSLEVYANGNLVQPLSDTFAITFFAKANEGANQSDCEWYVNSVKQNVSSNSFCLDPQAQTGEYVVKAVLGDLFAQQSLIVFEPSLAQLSGETLGEVGQGYTFAVSGITGRAKIDWYVNSELMKEEINTDSEFVFSPPYAGEYKIEAIVNGSAAQFDNEDFLIFEAEGEVVPRGLSIDYSNYPLITLNWENRDSVSTKVQLVRNGKTTLIDVDIATGWLDLSDYIDVTDSFFVGTSQEGVSFNGLSALAREYLMQQFVGGTLLIESYEQLHELFQYAIVFRPNAVKSSGQTTAKISFYMGYSSSDSIDKIANSFIDSLNMTGSYRWQINGSLKKDTVNELLIIFYADNEPTDFSTLDYKAGQLATPSFSKIGTQSALPVESYPLSPTKVSSTDQLFFTLEKGYKPDLAQDSNAQTVYNKAVEALSKITDPTMSQAQTTLAIYEYVMFLTTYDDTATQTSDILLAVKKGAYYLEGVFNSGFAVCDGIAKAFSLMSNMMGIECVRVTGLALQGSWFNHAWNKIRIDGKWYTADATWDITERTIGFKTYKLGSKSWFLLGESDFYLNRYETGSLFYPKAEVFEYGYYARSGLFLHNSSDLDEQLSRLNNYINQNYTKQFNAGGISYNADYFTVEIGVADSLKKSIESLLKNALTRQNTLIGSMNSIIIAVK